MVERDPPRRCHRSPSFPTYPLPRWEPLGGRSDGRTDGVADRKRARREEVESTTRAKKKPFFFLGTRHELAV